MAAPGLLLLLAVAAAHPEVDKNSATLVTELVTTALAKEPRFEVVASGDLRRQVEVESNSAALGCDSSSASCLAELAGALGAKVIVYGKLGTLDDVVVLTLDLFDSGAGKAGGRVALQEPTLSAISGRVDGAVHELVEPFVAKLPADGKVKVLVLDIEPPEQATPAGPASSAAPSSPVLVPGMVTAGVGAGVAIVGVLLALNASRLQNDAADVNTVSLDLANQIYGQRDLSGGAGLTLIGVGAAAVVVGGVLLGVAVAP
jgi:hypothetical protein